MIAVLYPEYGNLLTFRRHDDLDLCEVCEHPLQLHRLVTRVDTLLYAALLPCLYSECPCEGFDGLSSRLDTLADQVLTYRRETH